eukprot:scaffold9.g3095.t1
MEDGEAGAAAGPDVPPRSEQQQELEDPAQPLTSPGQAASVKEQQGMPETGQGVGWKAGGDEGEGAVLAATREHDAEFDRAMEVEGQHPRPSAAAANGQACSPSVDGVGGMAPPPYSPGAEVGGSVARQAYSPSAEAAGAPAAGARVCSPSAEAADAGAWDAAERQQLEGEQQQGGSEEGGEQQMMEDAGYADDADDAGEYGGTEEEAGMGDDDDYAAAGGAAGARAAAGAPPGAAYHHPHHAGGAGGGAAEEEASKLNELEAFLRQPDAVMEPDILGRLREYVLARGNPKQAVEHLTDSYVGYAQMSTLVCSWLKLTDDAAAAPGAAAPAVPPAAVPAAAAAGGAADELEALSPSRHLRKPSGADSSAELDEAHYLRQLARERFDPGRFAGIFTAGGSGAPPWLSGLISEPEGRRLIYELSAKYKNSLLLNFAIQKILMQVRRFWLREAAAARDEGRLAQLAAELAEGSSASQHAYLHAQQLVRAAAAAEGELEAGEAERDEGRDGGAAAAGRGAGAGAGAAAARRRPRAASRFLRLAQDLEVAAAAAHGGVVWKMGAWFADPGRSCGASARLQAAAGIVADLLAGAGAGGTPPTSELIRLYRLYFSHHQRGQQQQQQGDSLQQEQQPPPQQRGRQQPPAGAAAMPPPEPGGSVPAPARDMPPVALLCHPRVFEVLLAGLFSPTRQLPPEAYAACSGLLGLAAAAVDARSQHGPPQEEQQEQHGAGRGGDSSSSDQGLDLSEVTATHEALETAADLARRTLHEHRSSEADLAEAARVLEYPCCAAGVLHMLGAQLSSADYWQSSYRLAKQPPFLGLLAALVPAAPGLHPRLLGVLGAALRALGNADHDLAKGLLNVAVALVAAGRVSEVLRWAEGWAAGGADPSLLRHLAFRILERAAPPYSAEFAGSMVRLMVAGGVRRARLGARDWGLRALLREFGAACAAVQFSPPLAAAEAQLVQDVSSDRPPGYS